MYCTEHCTYDLIPGTLLGAHGTAESSAPYESGMREPEDQWSCKRSPDYFPGITTTVK